MVNPTKFNLAILSVTLYQIIITFILSAGFLITTSFFIIFSVSFEIKIFDLVLFCPLQKMRTLPLVHPAHAYFQSSRPRKSKRT